MSGMPSESQIRTAVWKLKSHAGRFQELAESVMRIKRGGPYRNIIPQGRNTELQTTIGYPDAYAIGGSGELYLIETTVGDWRKHLDDEDLPGITKISQAGHRVSEFTLFCMTESELLIKQQRKEPKVRQKPRVEKKSVDDYKAAITALGVPAAGVQFFFLDQLVKELRNPAYARVLAELGLPIDITPFYTVKTRLFVSDGGPTAEEYEAGSVVATDLLSAIKGALSSGGRLLVEGGSGLGKTTLATAFAFDWLLTKERGAFYIDLDAYDDPAVIHSQIIQQLKLYGCRENLFILDNSHRLKPELLKQVMSALVDPTNGPTILALSRNLNAQVAETLCADVNANRMHLSLRIEDLRAAYSLMVRRFSPSNSNTLPSDANFLKWLSMHADLVSFTLALRGAEAHLKAGLVPALTEQDAIDHLRARYINHAPEDEREMLAIVALCARFDFPASSTSLQHGEPRQSLARGLIVEQVAKNRERRYGLAHAKIGPLLLKALEKNEGDIWKSVIERDSFQACFIAQRLLQTGVEKISATEAKSKAREILQSVGGKIWKFSARFSPGYSGVIASLYKAVGLETTFAESLMAEISQFIETQDGFLAGLPLFLQFVDQKEFHEEAEKVWSDLLNTMRNGRMTIAACLAPVATIQNVLLMAERRDSKILATLKESVCKEEVATAIANKFAALTPDLAESILADFERLTPTLHDMLATKLRVGTVLKPFMDDLLKAQGRPAIRAWLRRTQLLRVMSNAPSVLLPPDWLKERDVTVMQLLLNENDSVRSMLDPQVQDLIGTWAKQNVRTQNADLISSIFTSMICMADRERALLVDKFIKSLKQEVMMKSLQRQAMHALGKLLIGASPIFDQSKPFSTVKSVILEVTRHRIEQALFCKSGKLPGVVYIASNIAVAKLAGAKSDERWLEQASAMVGQALMILPSFKFTVPIVDKGRRLEEGFLRHVESVFIACEKKYLPKAEISNLESCEI